MTEATKRAAEDTARRKGTSTLKSNAMQTITAFQVDALETKQL